MLAALQRSIILEKEVEVCPRVPPGIRGDDILGIGHQRHLVGLHLEYQVEKFFGGISLDIELGADGRPQLVHVGIANVPLVGARVHGDALGSKGFAIERDFQYIRNIAASCVAQGSYFVDINT